MKQLKEMIQTQEQEGRAGLVVAAVVVISIFPVLGGLGHRIASDRAD